MLSWVSVAVVNFPGKRFLVGSTARMGFSDLPLVNVGIIVVAVNLDFLLICPSLNYKE